MFATHNKVVESGILSAAIYITIPYATVRELMERYTITLSGGYGVVSGFTLAPRECPVPVRACATLGRIPSTHLL